MRIIEVLVILLIGATIKVADTSKILKCPLIDNDCHCSEYGEVEIQCPKFEPRIYVKIQPNNFLNFECEKSLESDYNLLPAMHLPEAQTIRILRCPLPLNQSLIIYFKNLNIEIISSLKIISGGVIGHNSLQHVHLKGFEDITSFELRGDKNNFQNLASDLFVNMTKLARVTIQNANIQLSADLFAPLKNLKFLELGNNKIANFEPGILTKNLKLEQLNLWGNNLRNLTKEAFVGLENLKLLDISTAGIEWLNSDLFTYLRNLTHLNLSGNNFSSLPDSLFAYNRKLTEFKMLENRIPIDSLPTKLFFNLTMLSNVFIKSRLRKIPEDIFMNSASIVNIRLNGNELKVLPEKLFCDQKILSKLDLSYNWIVELPEKLFEGTPEIKELRLNNNRLSSIPDKLFQPLEKLANLQLGHNQIASLPSGVFVSLQSLKILNLESNGLKLETILIYNSTEVNVPVSSRFQRLENLENLNLRNNSITTIFEDYSLRNLQFVDMSHNKMISLSKTDLQFSSRTKVTIDLSYNQIEHIDFSEIIDEENLPKVDVILENNPFKCDCNLLHFVEFIRDPANREKSNIIVKVDNLRCAQPERMFGRKVGSVQPAELLCSLDDAKSNKQKRCPASCSSCEIRKFDQTLLMDCYGNVSMSLLPLISEWRLKKLELNLENQNLTEMPKGHSEGFHQITKLLLNNNNIKRLGDLPRNLVALELQNNQIETLNNSVIQALNNSKTLQNMKLSGNPWRCDCSFVKSLSFIQKSYMNIADYDDMKCADGHFISQLSASILCSDEKLIVVIMSMTLGISSLIIGVFAALYYKYQKQIKMWLYSHNLCLWFVTEDDLDKDKSYDAFVSYAHQDGDFITDHLVPQLENCVIPYKLCLHERDWSPGLEISTQISNSINDSKRTIVVMSPHYLNSNWAQWEFRVAQSHAATEKRSRIIVILYGDIGDISKLEPDIRDYLKLNTYVKWGDRWFWEKLHYAMPHVKGQGPKEDKSKGLVKTAIKSSVDDKLELIKPVSVTPPQLTTPPAEQIVNPLVSNLNAKNAAKNQEHSNGHNGCNGHINGAYVINTSSRQSDV